MKAKKVFESIKNVFQSKSTKQILKDGGIGAEYIKFMQELELYGIDVGIGIDDYNHYEIKLYDLNRSIVFDPISKAWLLFNQDDDVVMQGTKKDVIKKLKVDFPNQFIPAWNMINKGSLAKKLVKESIEDIFKRPENEKAIEVRELIEKLEEMGASVDFNIISEIFYITFDNYQNYRFGADIALEYLDTDNIYKSNYGIKGKDEILKYFEGKLYQQYKYRRRL